MKCKVISGFPGIGKSYLSKDPSINSVDLDVSSFHWVEKKKDEWVKNPEFPKNYLDAIKYHLDEGHEYIFVSSHKEIRDLMRENGIYFHLVYPDADEKENYIKRYKNRGSTQEFIDLINEKWDEWTRECRKEWDGCANIELPFSKDGKDWYLSDIINDI